MTLSNVPTDVPSDMPSDTSAASGSAPGFAYTREQFAQLVEDTLERARKLGATDAGVEVSEGTGLSVSVRKGEIENVERNRDKAIGVSVYLGQRRGNASTSDFSPAALQQTVQAAYDIARFTAEDSAAGLPDEADMAPPEATRRDLGLFYPWLIDAEGAAEIALRCEAAALSVDARITNSEGAAVSAQQSHFFSGNSRGFRGGYASSRHSISGSAIAGKGRDMQRDGWYSSMRDALDLAAPEVIGRYGAERALARLKSRKVKTCEVPVLVERGINTVLIVGTVTNVCCESSARDAATLGYRVVMIADANATVFDDWHNATLTTIYRSFGDVRSTDDVLELLTRR